jgi:hypothetical protein
VIKKGVLGKKKQRPSNYLTHAPDGNRLQNTAVIAIFTLIKMGIDDRKIFRKFLASHGLLPKTERTLSEYITQARRKIDHDFGNTAWLTEKIQVAYLDDYKKIWDHTDQYMDKNSELLDYIYQKAKDKSKRIYDKEDKFYEFLDMGTVHSTIKVGLEAMSFKKSMMEKGFFVYSFKRYIDTLLSRMSGEISEEQKQNILANDPMLKSIEAHSPITSNKLSNEDSSLKHIGQDPDKEFQLAEHLQGVKKKFGENSEL